MSFVFSVESKKKAFWRLLLNKLFGVPLTLIAFPFPYFHIQWKSIGAKIVRLHHLLCSTKILWSQKDSKTVWLTTILKYFFIDFHSIFYLHYGSQWDTKPFGTNNLQNILFFCSAKNTMEVNETQKHSVTNNLQNIFFWVPQKYNGSQWDPKTVWFPIFSKYLWCSKKILWKLINPLLEVWWTGDLTNHNAKSAILSNKQTRQESRLMSVDLNLKNCVYYVL